MVNRGEEKVRVHMNVVPRSTGNTNLCPLFVCVCVWGGGGGGAGSPSHNALLINYIINRRWSRDLLVVSGVHGVEFTVS